MVRKKCKSIGEGGGTKNFQTVFKRPQIELRLFMLPKSIFGLTSMFKKINLITQS